MSFELFTSIGLTEQRAKETLKNKQLTERLENIISTAQKLNPSIDKSQGQILYHCATKLKDARSVDYVLPYVVKQLILNELQVNAAVQFFGQFPVGDVDKAQFEEFCGVGVVVTPAELKKNVSEVISAHKEELIQNRYSFPIGQLISEVKNKPKMKWADGKLVKQSVDAEIETLLGPKTEEDSKKKKPVPKPSPTPASASEKDTPVPSAKEITFDMTSEEKADMFKGLKLHKVGENHLTDGYIVTPQNMERLRKHFEEVNGTVQTRFPPEPNGIVHIGHAKAININFGYAKLNNGRCNLRYDDTNPEKEEERFFKGILEMVRWLGFEPYRITHSSDFFETLFEYAIRLIKAGVAYVCHQKFEDVDFKAKEVSHSPWRDRPIVESLQLFNEMRAGKFDEGEATLRAKYVMEDGKVDPVLYRIKFCEHYRTQDKWCIYPTYDFTHPLCDAIENITHSLCTKEFQSHRSMYYWLCDAVGIYCPVQWEYGRLNLYYSVVSKRKIAKLVEKGHVKDWDDPRLFTLPALRRRGYPPSAINDFVHRLGVTMAQVNIDPELLESCVRNDLNRNAPRVMAVLQPLKVVIENFQQLNCSHEVTIPDFPDNPEKGSKKVSFTKELYIDRCDFLEVADKNFKRLTKAQPVGLKYADMVLTVKEVVYTGQGDNTAGNVKHLVCSASPRTDSNKPKGYIQWVSSCSLECTVRLYDRLFLHKCPEDKNLVPGGFLTCLNPDSLKEYTGRVDRRVEGAGVFEKFQFERIGYFSVDPDSSDQGFVFNRTVSLKEDSSKTM